MLTIIKKILLLLFSVLFTLAVLEVCVRLGEPLRIAIDEGVFSSIRLKNQEKQWKQLIIDQQVSSSTFNIYYFGESTMDGEPYKDTIPKMVEQMLAQPIDEKRVRWVTLSERAIDLAESERRLNWVLNNKDITHPSMLIVYAGHNEFLRFHDCCGFAVSEQYGQTVQHIINSSKLVAKLAEAFHLYKVDIQDRSFFDEPVTPIADFPNVIDEYNQRIQKMADSADRAQIPIIISTVAGNYSDFEPNRSVFCEESQEQSRFKSLIDQAQELDSPQSLNEAKNLYIAALNMCDQFAEAHYRLGKVYQAMNLNDDAWNEYQKAVDLDRMPIRAQSSQNAFIRSMPQTEYVHTVDAVQTLRESSPDKLIGNNLMADGHHPNLAGYNIISQLIAQKIAALTNTRAPLATVGEDFMVYLAPDDESKKAAYIDSAEWFIRLSTWRYDGSSRLQAGVAYLEKADQLQPPMAKQFILMMIVSILEGDKQKAHEYYDKAKALNSKDTATLTSNYWVEQFMQRLQRL